MASVEPVASDSDVLEISIPTVVRQKQTQQNGSQHGGDEYSRPSSPSSAQIESSDFQPTHPNSNGVQTESDDKSTDTEDKKPVAKRPNTRARNGIIKQRVEVSLSVSSHLSLRCRQPAHFSGALVLYGALLIRFIVCRYEYRVYFLRI